jgi:hypothetical protein
MPVQAQAPTAFWAEGRLARERDTSFGTPGAGPVFGGALGVDWRRFGLRFDADVPPVETGTVIETYADGPVLVRSTSVWRRHSPGWSAAATWTPVAHERYAISVVVGWANATHREAPAVTTVERLAQNGTVIDRREYTGVGLRSWWPGIVFGLDVPLRFGRIAIVPEARVIAFPLADRPRAHIVRGGVACRWRF